MKITTKIAASIMTLSAILNTACTDSWDDHYAGTVSSSNLWEAISSYSDLSNFKHVIEGCGYDKNLAGSQTFSVFAPNNSTLSASQADSLINAYNTQKNAGIKDDQNTVIKQFIQNHISPFTHTVSSLTNEQVTMMNGKYQTLTGNAIDNISLLTKNDMYCNGVLYTIGDKINYFPNIYEYLGLDNEVDSVYNFIKSHNEYELNKSASVAGSIVNGETVYLDSVMNVHNELYSSLGYINSEDSSYIMVVPTNSEWARLTNEYKKYFNYDKSVNKRDSLQNVFSRLAILWGTAFNRTDNTDAALQDSAVAVNAYSYEMRTSLNTDPYYVFYKPYTNIFANTQSVTCSNGTVMKKADWNIDIHNTFAQKINVEATSLSNQDTIIYAEDPLTVRQVSISNPFYDKIMNNSFVEVIPENTSVNPEVSFSISNVLSNLPYDVYVVFAPAIAYDTLAAAEDRLPCRIQATLSWNDANGKLKTQKSGNLTTKEDEVDSLLVFENITIPTCSYGLSNQVKINITSRVASTATSKYTRTMRIACIIFKPHEE